MTIGKVAQVGVTDEVMCFGFEAGSWEEERRERTECFRSAATRSLSPLLPSRFFLGARQQALGGLVERREITLWGRLINGQV